MGLVPTPFLLPVCSLNATFGSTPLGMKPLYFHRSILQLLQIVSRIFDPSLAMPNDTNIRIAAYSVPLVFITGFLLSIAFLLTLAVLIFSLFDAVLLVIAFLVHFAASGHQSR